MKAARITATGTAPVYGDAAEPTAGEGEAVITVTAAPISPIVRLRAAAPVPAESGVLFVGLDGVGTNGNGQRVYFLFPKPPFGALAEKTLVPAAMTVPVPDGLGDAEAAAIATAGMSSWAALTRRVPIKAGQTVLVTAANGAAGRLALQVARHLGAGRVIAVTRSTSALAGLSADQGIALEAEGADAALQEAFRAGVDIVLDYAWGAVAERIIAAVSTARGAPMGEPRLRYAIIGASAGQTAPLAAYAFQSSKIELIGSGIGSVAVRDYLAACAELLGAAEEAGFEAPHEIHALSEIGEIWEQAAQRRIILRPDQA
ncbi:quinone oxidoreductase family protein [Gallaecimonas mangrovi]|uniref:quinone oxidoreductase family protein n=1 Tax=Gallaecimonas mangrovi TaxID=2291597 RepID=UPI000E203529|nr:zinc-binding alcohol dehydrogenase family protein [Gallaecimonas mangrovi]